ncbi:hypothetical protein LPJ75_000564 [Coemansia sp. RSA 2598]|nr:hypothetical protein LPJ75_000564 [Coemansia sp. RSA 2598]
MDLFYALDCNSDGEVISSSADFTKHLDANHLTPLSMLSPVSQQASMLVVVSTLGKVSHANNGMDYFMSFRIVDPTIYPIHPKGGQNTIAITIFRRSMAEFPTDVKPSDIMYLDNVQVNDFNGKITLSARRACRWNIIGAGQPIDSSLHPMVGYLRNWWTQCGVSDLTLSGDTGYTNKDAASTTAVVQQQQQPQQQQAVSAQSLSLVGPAVSKHKYLRTVSEIRPDMYPDLHLEILAVDPPQTDAHGRIVVQRCLATDYSQNPALASDRHQEVPGSRVIPCDFVETDEIPRMPELAVGKIYKLRHTHVVKDDDWGMCVRVTRDVKYPRTLVVVEVSPYSEDLRQFFERKEACGILLAAQKELALASSVARPERSLELARQASSGCHQPPAGKQPNKAPIINVKYRIKAGVIRRQPAEAWETLDAKNQQIASRFILELSQGDSKCLALFLARGSQKLHALLGLEPLETQQGNSGLERTRIIKRIERLFALEHIDLIVASFLVSLGSDGALARCLLITDVLSDF